MTDVGFYHLTTSMLEQALPKLLEKSLEARKRVLVLCDSEERVEYLNALLWTANRGFLPHGSKQDGDPSDHPIWLTTEDFNANQSQFLLCIDGSTSSDISSYERVLHLFNGNDPEATSLARQQWKQYQTQGHSITYWKQNSQGSWEQG